MRLSKEQEMVTTTIKTHHIQIIAVAGCGKTTTNLFVCQRNADKNILLLTYNASLKLETKQKMDKMQIENTQVHTYHSFAYHFYKKCLNDYGLFEICKENTPPMQALNFDIIILDEMQDMTRLYFDFVMKIYKDNTNKRVHFCILGDPYQTIYQYNGSDTNYFLLFPNISKFNYVPWEKCVLNHTFRCTDQVANFLNVSMLGVQRILTSKKSEKVRYLICDTFSDKIFAELQYYFSLGYTHKDIFVLSPSVKSYNSPISKLSELCMDSNIPVFISYSDDDKPNEKVLENKLVFLTFHQSKGLERKVVIVMNFDNSYFMYYKKDQDPETCPNELYVAVTRSAERLSVVHDFKSRHLPFLRQSTLAATVETIMFNKISFESSERRFLERMSEETSRSNNCEYIEASLNESAVIGPNSANIIRPPAITKSVMQIIKHMPFKYIYNIVQCLHITEIEQSNESQSKYRFGKRMHDANKYIEIPAIVEQGNIYENVSNINSLLIMSMFEFRKKGTTAIALQNKNFVKYYAGDDIPFILQLCNIKLCRDNRFRFKLHQITNYDWVDPQILERCIHRLESLPISDISSVFEYAIKYTNPATNKALSGRIDCLDGENVWEFKCVSSLDYQHYLQVGMYLYLFHKIHPERTFKFYLYNVYQNMLLKVELKSTDMLPIIGDSIESSFDFQNHFAHESFPTDLFQ